MKRILSLLLAISMLVSLAPAILAADAETAVFSLAMGEPTKKTVTVFGTEETADYYEIPVKIKNNTAAAISLDMVECYIRFDDTVFTAANIQVGKKTRITGITYDENLQDWNEKSSVTGGLAIVAAAGAPDDNFTWVEVPAKGEAALFTLNLQRLDGIENGEYPITFAEPFQLEGVYKQNLVGLEYQKDSSTEQILYMQSENKLGCSASGKITITDGSLPTLGSVTISPEATSVFASGKDFTLSAKSASGKDITSLVTFKIQKDNADFSTGLTIAGSKLTVASSGSLANVGTYTVVATPNGDGCTGSASAVFTITPQTITTPSVTVNGFSKGAAVNEVSYSVDNLHTVPTWYEGTGDLTALTPVGSTEKFKAATTYTLVLTLTPTSGNYKLADGTTVTVIGLGDDQTVPLTDNGDGTYSATVTARTGAKETLRPDPTAGYPACSTVYFGQKLGDSKINSTGAYALDTNGNHIPGHYEWVDPEQSVGDAADSKGFKAWFIPNDSDLYEKFETTLYLRVQRVLIDVSSVAWSNTALTYNGENQSVTLTLPEGIAALVNVDYEGNTEKAVGDYTAKATLTVKDTTNYMFRGAATTDAESTYTTSTNWKINKAALTPTTVEKPVIYGTTNVTVTLADLGLTQSGIEISAVDLTTSETNPLITGTQISVDKQSVEFTLRTTDAIDANNNVQGTATVKFTSTNYNVADATVTIKIVDKTPVTLAVKGSASSFPYGTTAADIQKTLTIGNAPAGVDLTYTYTDAAGNPVNDISKATPAENYKVTISGQDAANVYTGTYTFAITKLDLKDATIVAANTLTYTGSEQTQNVTVKYGSKVIDADDYTVTGNKQTNAGRYTLTVTANNASTLYTGSKTYEFIILKAVPKTIDFSVTVPQNVTYDGQPHPATVAQANPDLNMGGFTVSYVGIDGTVDAPVNAGEYTVSIKVNGNDNYAAVTVPAGDNWKFTIAKATPTLEIETAADATYTGQPYNEASKITLTSASNVSVNTYLYYSDKNCTVEANPVNVGTYWVKAKFNGDTNHNAVTSAAKQFNITMASYSLAIEAASVEYNKTPYSSSNIKVTPNLSVHFGYYADKALTKSIDAPTEVGTYYVRAFYEGDANHNYAYSNTASFEIKKATPATPPEIKVDNTDTTLGELGDKMLVKIGVPGTIYWYGPDGKLITKPHNTKIEANTEYSWTFVPTDGNNYNEIKGKTTPYVRDDLSWLPGVLGGGSSFSFHDVTRFDYYYDSVKWAADNGIASGTSRFAFSPDAVCTRAQTVTFLWRAAGSPLPRYRVSPFTDVHSYDYYYEAVLWAVEQGITTGLTATTFGPDETVTRGQVATFLYRAASAAKPNTFNPFTDVKPTAYNYGAILWAYDNRITTGTSTTTFSPDAFCTRAQIVTFLYRYYQGR